MPDLIHFVINLVIFGIVLAILYWIVMMVVGLFEFLPQPKVQRIVQILFALIVLLWLLSWFSGGPYVFYGGAGRSLR